MSDDEDDYEYEYDDDAMEEDNFQYTDDEEEPDSSEIALENAYYNSKALRDSDVSGAEKSFESVVSQESESPGTWTFKSLKQLMKLQLRTGNTEAMLHHYRRLLDCVRSGNISPNAVEKGINGMLERVATLGQQSRSGDIPTQSIALQVYDATLPVFHPDSGPCPNERLWFKTNIKFGQLLYETNQTPKLQQVLRELQIRHSEEGSSTQSLEIYALQIQLYSRQKENKKLKQTFEKAMNVRGGIPHPRTIALIQELGGKMHMESKDYESAGKTFFQAFKSYDEAGDSSRLRCLKYLVLASMLHASTINPFDSQEARPYRDDPEIVAMTSLVHAFQNNQIQDFERILRRNQGRIMNDEFIREHIEDLLRTIRTQVLRRAIEPYTQISLAAIARELNGISVREAEALLVNLILDGTLTGHIDRVSGVLVKESVGSTSQVKNMEQLACMEQIAAGIKSLSRKMTNVRMKESTAMRGFVH